MPTVVQYIPECVRVVLVSLQSQGVVWWIMHVKPLEEQDLSVQAKVVSCHSVIFLKCAQKKGDCGPGFKICSRIHYAQSANLEFKDLYDRHLAWHLAQNSLDVVRMMCQHKACNEACALSRGLMPVKNYAPGKNDPRVKSSKNRP